jgi:hypothetical protein
MILRLVAFLAISTPLFSGDAGLQVITLKDSSVIRARVTEMSGGFYVAKSPLLGEIKIPSGEVVSIRAEGTSAQSEGAPATNCASQPDAPSAQAPAPASLESLRSSLSSKVQNLVSTHDGMNAVTNFSNNPDMKAVLNDPQVMQAIQSDDYNSLMQSPVMKRLLDNPQTQALIQSVLKPQGAPQPKASPGKPAADAE